MLQVVDNVRKEVSPRIAQKRKAEFGQFMTPSSVARFMASLMDVEDWQRIARQELERRATSIVQALDDATLEAIAAGEIDMRAMCRQVLEEQGRAQA